VSAALNEPGISASRARTLFAVEIFLTIAFGVEAALKLFVLGAWGHADAYLHQPGFVLELLIATHSLVSVCATGVKWLYFFRPLLSLFAFTETRIVVRALLAAVPKIFVTFLLSTLVTMVWGILGVSLFQARALVLASCYSATMIFSQLHRLLMIDFEALSISAFSPDFLSEFLFHFYSRTLTTFFLCLRVPSVLKPPRGCLSTTGTYINTGRSAAMLDEPGRRRALPADRAQSVGVRGRRRRVGEFADHVRL
jgi:hypothetical protein